jgi:hypothetical protein
VLWLSNHWGVSRVRRMDAMVHGMSKRHSTFPPDVGIDPTGLLVAKPHGFLLDAGVVTTIDPPGATFTFPTGINNRGQVVGFYDDGGRGLGFMRENGALTTPAVPPGTFGTAFSLDIDDRGRIFGVYF